ncbi:hypothetical protein [Nostoc sp. NMS8]|uniref:hypothetical protein n=1 Tax=Nostoc sp. NMS8 TaxID=2815392 RepID=UPI0025D9EBAF|nr:hypothetical protein [Nostoc sp. NMS8]MBN3957512.1 hypothetical protein [Nostoc sp. NMS8]
MTEINKPLDQERLLLTLEQLQITLEQLQIKMEQIIQINLIRYDLLEKRVKELERLQTESSSRGE